jgi:hypothetical protein
VFKLRPFSSQLLIVVSTCATWLGTVIVSLRRKMIWHIQCLSAESSHWYNIMVKSTKILQFWYFSHDYANLRCLNNKNLNMKNLDFSAKPLWHQKQTLINTSWVEPVLNIPNYFIITLRIALLIALPIDFPLLDIVSDLLHFYILVLLITFSYAMRLRKY